MLDVYVNVQQLHKYWIEIEAWQKKRAESTRTIILNEA